MKTPRRALRAFSWMPLVAIALSACVGQPERLWVKAPGWSRAQLIAETRVQDPVPIALDDKGNIYIFSFSSTADATHPRLTALDRAANTLWDRTYERVSVSGPRQPKLLWDGRKLQLFWIGDETLYRATADASGALSEPTSISDELLVDSFDVSIDSRDVVATWFAGPVEDPGLYSLDPGGFETEPTLVDPEGVQPDIQFDQEGTLHAIWSQDSPEPGPIPIFYGAYPGGRYQPGKEQVLASPHVPGAATFRGPKLGLDSELAYVFWSTTKYSGLEAGKVESQYTYLTKGDPSSAVEAQRLAVPLAFTLAYENVEPDLDSGPRVALDSSTDLGGVHISEIIPNETAADELAVAILARLDFPMRKTRPQVSALYFEGGAPNSYQQLSFTPASSSSPSILSDRDGQLYLTWLERGDEAGWGVYFASTADDLGAALRGLDLGDVGRLAAETTFGLLSGGLLIPIGLIWSVPAMIALALTGRLRRSEDGIAGIGGLLSLALALVLLWAIKLGVLPAIQTYVPFSAWIPVIPVGWDDLLRVGVPVLIAAAGFLAAWVDLSRRGEDSPYRLVAVYAVVDSVLTMAIYGVFIYGII